MNCKSTKPDHQTNDLYGVVTDYINKYRVSARRELRFYAIQKTLGETIKYACLSLMPSGKRHYHQRRIPLVSLVEANRILQARLSDIQKCLIFAELHTLIDKNINSIHRIGELTVYDIAHRIGVKLGLEPDMIYLHAGTAQAAKFLFPIKNMCTLSKMDLPKPFHCLKPYEIEDCLCIYKENIKKIVQHAPPAGRGEAPRP